MKTVVPDRSTDHNGLGVILWCCLFVPFKLLASYPSISRGISTTIFQQLSLPWLNGFHKKPVNSLIKLVVQQVKTDSTLHYFLELFSVNV